MNLPDDDRKFARTHAWALAVGDGRFRIGISDFAQSELGDVVFVELPGIGRQVRAEEAVVVIESVKAASDIRSPISGEVVAVNAELSTQPELINQEPYAAWVFELVSSAPEELEKLLSADAYSLAVGSA